jgi:hypothetical protein
LAASWATALTSNWAEIAATASNKALAPPRLCELVFLVNSPVSDTTSLIPGTLFTRMQRLFYSFVLKDKDVTHQDFIKHFHITPENYILFMITIIEDEKREIS